MTTPIKLAVSRELRELLDELDAVIYEDPTSGAIKIVLVREDYQPTETPCL